MSPYKELLNVLIEITDISNNRKLDFTEKLSQILLEIVHCMQVRCGSIMLLKNRMTLEVVAATNPDIIGIQQRLEVDFPSSWVVKNKKPLYVDSSSPCSFLISRFKHYEGDAFFLVPLINNGRAIGVVNITEKIGKNTINKDLQSILSNILGTVIVALDNHRRTKSLKKKQKTLRNKNLDLQQLEKLRTELFNVLIHDLRSPVSDILTNIEILSCTAGDENIVFVEKAQSSCNTLYSMISNLLDISLLEDGKIKLIYEETISDKLIENSISGL